MAESWIVRDLSPASGLWEALGAMPREKVLAFLPRRLAESPELDGTFLENPLLPPFHRDEELLWHTRLAILGQSTHDQATVEVAWAQLAEMPVAWSMPLVEAGFKLWPQLDAHRIEALTATIGNPIVRVGLRVIVREKQSSSDLAESTLRDLDAIPEASDRLHWSLRLLATQQESSLKRGQVRAVLRYLEKIRYGVATADLARFLDLVARSLPSELSRQVANVIWSPGSCSERLRTLAATAQTRALLEHLLAHAEQYAAAVSIDPSEGFTLRGGDSHHQPHLRRAAARRSSCRHREPPMVGFGSGVDRFRGSRQSLRVREGKPGQLCCARDVPGAGGLPPAATTTAPRRRTPQAPGLEKVPVSSKILIGGASSTPPSNGHHRRLCYAASAVLPLFHTRYSWDCFGQTSTNW